MASSGRPKPKKIHSSGKKYWEDLIYVQDEKKKWNARHSYLADFEGVVYLLTYTTKPSTGGKSERPKEYLILHKVIDGIEPHGFSEGDGTGNGDKMITVGLQTKNPEGLKFVGLKNNHALEVFIRKAEEALGQTPKQPPRSRDDALPKRPTSAYAGMYNNPVQMNYGDSLGHLGGSTMASSVANVQAPSGERQGNPTYSGFGEKAVQNWQCKPNASDSHPVLSQNEKMYEPLVEMRRTSQSSE